MKMFLSVFVAAILLFTSCCIVWGDVSCSKCETAVNFAGCANQACQNFEGQCYIGQYQDPETGEMVNTYVGSSSYKLVHMVDPKYCGDENSSIGADGNDCKGTTEYVCYQKISYSGTDCGGGQCQEFSTASGCSISVPHHNCLVIPAP